MSNNTSNKASASVLFGAAFLMATSAIGPGFLTQTSKFTAQYGAPLIMIIICAIFMDVCAQMNIWSVIGVTGMRAQDIANKMLPGLGVVLAILVSIGGLAFNVGNVGGVALGFNAMLGIPEKIGAAIAGCLGIIIFLNKNAKALMDKISTVLAAIILITVLTVAVISKPPVGEIAGGLVSFGEFPTMFVALTTLLGGSCGGYIPFSGAHRLVDAGVEGAGNFRKSVSQGVATSGVVRILLFVAVMGVCAQAAGNADTIIAASNPAAEAFRLAAGDLGYRLFGLCLFSAGISSVVGAAFTSVSFLKTLHPFIMKNEKWFVVGFIAFSTCMMVILGGAATLLIIAGAVNGLILPISLGTMLAASKSKKIVGDYKHPTWLFVCGLVVVCISAVVGVKALPGILKLFA